jgi:signal peptidase I
MFAPKWKKEAKLLDKAAKKFLNYKRDLLDASQIAEIESRRDDLKTAVKADNKEQCEEASKQLQATCESSLPRYQSQGWVEENIEVFFVAIVVALGLRAYVVQPFRIPTGSMQPTLNGIIAHSVKSSDDFPSFPVKAIQWATHGRSYVDLVLDEDKELRQKNPVEEVNFLHFFTRTKINFADGTSLTFPGPKTALMNANGMGFGQKCGYPTNDMTPEAKAKFELQLQHLKANPTTRVSYDIHGKRQMPYLHPFLKKGTVIARGFIDSGDLILVDKMSYHFRRPNRGEVFVFDTRNIKRIHEEARASGGIAGSHYIKRLAAVPGDELEIKGFDLYINGKRAQEPGFLKVMSEKEGYHYGYKPSERLAHGKTFKARFSKHPGMNEYIALGDNSFNSSDSRHWGTVKEYNVIGPASIALWPFASGHWGIIK